MLELEKSLVYFTTSLRSNEAVLEKLIKVESIKKYPEDTELLEDVIIENTQAIEMANIYSGILRSMMDAFASVISNNLNDVMKILSVITIVMSIPTIIFSAYGMNLAPSGMPFSSTTLGICNRNSDFYRCEYCCSNVPVQEKVFLIFLATNTIHLSGLYKSTEKGEKCLMNWIDKMERKFRGRGIPNLTVVRDYLLCGWVSAELYESFDAQYDEP